MADIYLAALIDDDTPKINPIIGNGLAVEHMKDVEPYVDSVFKSAAKGFPAKLTYDGCLRCTPAEEFGEITKKKGTKRTFDVARSDIYMMKFFFSYDGKQLPPRYINLPYVSDAGYITLGGSRFNISPTMTDRVISVGIQSIFIRLLRDRLNIERVSHHYMVDNKRETIQVTWSLIYHKNSKMKKLRPTIKANTDLVMYLLCKYGFTETFRQFGNCAPVVGGVEINDNTYPEKDWHICTSAKIKPKGVGRTASYTPSEIRVAVRKTEMTGMVRNMLGGFFYVVDHFPTRVLPEYINSVNERRLWMVLMGHILFTGTIPEGKLADDIGDHITSLDEYLDGLVVAKLKDIGIDVENIYQLFGKIIDKYNDWLLTAADKVSSMADKELSILYYVLYDITSAIFKLHFKLKAASKKELTEKEVIATMNLTLRSGMIFGLTKNHGEISTVSSPGDNKAFKITSLLVPQTASNRMNSRKDRQVPNDPSKRLHVTIAEFGGFSNLPKSAPDGRSRLNPHCLLDDKSVVVRKPHHVEILDPIQELFKR